MKRVYIASPFRGSTKEETRQNIIYARFCMLDSLERGEAPYLSHLLYTQVWSEASRESGLRAGDDWRRVADLIACYTDLGTTEGMRRALTSGHPHVETRGIFWRGTVPQPASPWECRQLLAGMPLEVFPELRA